MKKIKEAASLFAGIGLVVLFIGVSGIGCPIKWITGISCAGCGMTRALLCAVQLQFGEAFRYHPLFWSVPFLVLFIFLGQKIPSKPRKALTWIAVGCFTAVYLVRLFSPDNDIVTADPGSSLIARLWENLHK